MHGCNGYNPRPEPAEPSSCCNSDLGQGETQSIMHPTGCSKPRYLLTTNGVAINGRSKRAAPARNRNRRRHSSSQQNEPGGPPARQTATPLCSYATPCKGGSCRRGMQAHVHKGTPQAAPQPRAQLDSACTPEHEEVVQHDVETQHTATSSSTSPQPAAGATSRPDSCPLHNALSPGSGMEGKRGEHLERDTTLRTSYTKPQHKK